MKRRTVQLSAEERAALARAGERDRRPYLRERAAALLKIADGMAAHAVARGGLLGSWAGASRTRATAGSTPMRSAGCPAWSPSRGATAAFPPQQAAAVREVVRQPPALHGLERVRWRLQDLAQAVPALAAYTRPGLSQVLRRRHIRRHRGRLVVHSPDPASASKQSWIDRARQQAVAGPAAVRVLYGDEFTLYRQPTLAARYASPGEEPVTRLAPRFNSRWRLAAARAGASGRVTWTARTTMDRRGLCQFLTALRVAYPTEGLVLIGDHWPVHHHPAVLTHAAALDIELLWLPTYAPWLNPIEKLWRWLRQEVLHTHRLADRWDELKAAVAAFLARFDTASPDLLRYVALIP